MVVILGCGESGMGAALLAHKQSIPVFISDAGLIPNEFKNQLIELEIDFEENGHSVVYDCNPYLVIKSPGIPDNSKLIQFFIERNVEIISEIEWAFRYCKGKILAITGSNGKTTSTNLLYHILNSAKLDAVKVGNVGYSFARSVAESTHDYYVLEISSFQLDSIVHFKPYAAIILNITPDHLDRYEYKFENYAKSKFRITLNQNSEDHLILYKDKAVEDFSKTISTNAIIHWMQAILNESDELMINGKQRFNFSNSSLKGKHNAMNVSCVAEVCNLLGISDDQIQQALDTFRNDPHRLESVAKIDEIEFINDSKATNVDSVYWALDAMRKKVIWIAGGLDKGNDYKVLDELVNAKVKMLVALGKDNSKLLNYYQHKMKVADTHDMKSAVNVAFNSAQAGDVVLLSPACASFDLYNNYMHRGDEFRNQVLELKKQSAA